ncbi:MAG: DUF1152 domain-containing protein [Anaerolineae bacterium]|nr:DUF1152 domain-containing protein [Anaerolineae bacterium]
MNLNLPIIDRVSNSKSILIAGMGGGFDIFCGLPIYFELKALGLNVHLANYSFSPFENLSNGTFLTDSLVGVTADAESPYHYFPERYLAKWFREKRRQEITIWNFEKTGVRPLLENYQTLISHLKIDAIILIDGGVDSLLRGDETDVGTLLEDTVSLIAVSELKDVPVRMIACVGMGAEIDIAYTQIFENIAKLTELDAFLGACALTKRMTTYQDYEDALLFVQSRPAQDPSVINSSVISAVQGKHGNFHLTAKTKGSKLSISPLMSIYWFFELPAVARRNLLFSEMRYTDTITDAYRGLLKARRDLVLRKPSRNSLGLFQL